jgi:hypothetical protein
MIVSADEEGDDARSGPFCINFIICVTFENCVNNMMPNGKIGLVERSSSCQLIALPWLNLVELIRTVQVLLQNSTFVYK